MTTYSLVHLGNEQAAYPQILNPPTLSNLVDFTNDTDQADGFQITGFNRDHRICRRDQCHSGHQRKGGARVGHNRRIVWSYLCQWISQTIRCPAVPCNSRSACSKRGDAGRICRFSSHLDGAMQFARTCEADWRSALRIA